MHAEHILIKPVPPNGNYTVLVLNAVYPMFFRTRICLITVQRQETSGWHLIHRANPDLPHAYCTT